MLLDVIILDHYMHIWKEKKSKREHDHGLSTGGSLNVDGSTKENGQINEITLENLGSALHLPKPLLYKGYIKRHVKTQSFLRFWQGG